MKNIPQQNLEKKESVYNIWQKSFGKYLGKDLNNKTDVTKTIEYLRYGE
jgi:hypothetical protein